MITLLRSFVLLGGTVGARPASLARQPPRNVIPGTTRQDKAKVPDGHDGSADPPFSGHAWDMLTREAMGRAGFEPATYRL